MARKKNSKSLFEVLSRTDTTMSVPDWMKAKAAGDATAPVTETAGPVEGETAAFPEDVIDVEAETEPERNETIEYEEPEPADEVVDSNELADVETPVEESSEAVVEAPPVTPEPRWKRRLGDGQPSEKAARFSMNPRSIVVFLVAVGVLLLVAFVLGRVTAGRVSSEPASPQPAAPTNDAELRSVVNDDAPVTCVSGRRDPDRYFLIIETLRGNGDADKAEADRIIGFCKAHNLPADMVELQRGDQPRVAVWCLLGYRFTNSKPALDHAQKVEEIGQAYFQKYKTYTFQQRRKQDGSLRPFFFPGKVEQPVE